MNTHLPHILFPASKHLDMLVQYQTTVRMYNVLLYNTARMGPYCIHKLYNYSCLYKKGLSVKDQLLSKR